MPMMYYQENNSHDRLFVASKSIYYFLFFAANAPTLEKTISFNRHHLYPFLLQFPADQTQRKAGIEPIFDPQALGIANADEWTHKNGESSTENNK